MLLWVILRPLLGPVIPIAMLHVRITVWIRFLNALRCPVGVQCMYLVCVVCASPLKRYLTVVLTCCLASPVSPLLHSVQGIEVREALSPASSPASTDGLFSPYLPPFPPLSPFLVSSPHLPPFPPLFLPPYPPLFPLPPSLSSPLLPNFLPFLPSSP